MTSYDSASDAYRRLLDEYGRALAERDPSVATIFERAREAFERLRANAPADAAEAKVGEEMHLVIAFSHAVGAGHAEESQRVYMLMTTEDRQRVDAMERDEPGRVKIWLHSNTD